MRPLRTSFDDLLLEDRTAKPRSATSNHSNKSRAGRSPRPRPNATLAPPHRFSENSMWSPPKRLLNRSLRPRLFPSSGSTAISSWEQFDSRATTECHIGTEQSSRPRIGSERAWFIRSISLMATPTARSGWSIHSKRKSDRGSADTTKLLFQDLPLQLTVTSKNNLNMIVLREAASS